MAIADQGRPSRFSACLKTGAGWMALDAWTPYGENGARVIGFVYDATRREGPSILDVVPRDSDRGVGVWPLR